MTPELAGLLAGYNQWMNARMYEAAAGLEHEALVAGRGAFFGSILGTLNHLAVADTIWLQRFAAHPAGFASLQVLQEWPRPVRLDQALAPDLAGLRGYRQRLDALILDWVAELRPGHLAEDLAYANMAGVVSRRNFGALLAHFFNHQAHHRGQASTLLYQCGVDVGVTDLLALIPQSTD